MEQFTEQLVNGNSKRETYKKVNKRKEKKMSKSTAASDAWCVCVVYADVLDSDGGNNIASSSCLLTSTQTLLHKRTQHSIAQQTKCMIINKYLF